MKKVFIHIGQHKTGSTAIQDFLFQNETTLFHNDISYCPGTRLCLEGKPHVRHMMLSLKPHENFELIKNLANEIDTTPLNTFIISGEGFCRAAERLYMLKGLVDIKKALSKHEVKIIVYLRPQEELLQSLYNWRIKGGYETRCFSQYLEEYPKKRAVYFQYDKLLAPFAEIFGTENIIVRIYDRKKFEGGSIFTDFFTAMKIDWIQDLAFPNKSSNPPMPPKTLELRRNINKIFNFKNERVSLGISNCIKNSMPENDSLKTKRPCMLTYEEKSSLRNMFLSGNKSVAPQYAHNGSEELFPPVIPPREYYPPEEIMHYDEKDLHILIGKLGKELVKVSDEAMIAKAEAEALKQSNKQLSEKTLEIIKKLKGN